MGTVSSCVRALIPVFLLTACSAGVRPDGHEARSPRSIIEDPRRDGYALADAIQNLNRSHDSGLLTGLVAHIDDPLPLVRLRVAETLGRFGNPEGIPALERLIDDEDPAVRRAALVALFRRGIYRDYYSKDPAAVIRSLRSLLAEERGSKVRILARNTCSEVAFEETSVSLEAARLLLSLPDVDFMTRAEAEEVVSRSDLGLKRFSAG